MRPSIAAGVFVVGLIMSLTVVRADDLNVDFDPNTDFSGLKTFSLEIGKVTSPRPELDNPLFLKVIGRALRTSLVSKGLKEAADKPDLVVDFSVSSEDISTSARGTPVPALGAGRRGGRMVSTGPVSVRYTTAMLVIDITAGNAGKAIWRGVYHDEESTGSKLVQKLPEDAAKLLQDYPPRKK